MAKRSVKGTILKNLVNVPGWRSSQKLVVFESDDWGSIRMPSNEVFNNLLKSGIDLLSDDGFRFNKYDSLATSEDIASLFEVLSSVKDSTGRPAVFTPASVVVNPDFAKIKQSEFTEYFYEPFTDTLQRYRGCENSFELWKKGVENRLFVPQFHGREHLNVKVWMRALKGKHEKARQAFNEGMWGISTANDPEIKVEFQAAFDFLDPDDLLYQEEVIVSGLNLFEKLFGYRATYFVPPNGHLSKEIETVCATVGIKYLLGYRVQMVPMGQGKKGIRLHWLGQKNSSGLFYLTRNCLFEPSQPRLDWVDSCLYDISTAFRWRKPAIISTHRVNFIGALNKSNRDMGLDQLNRLLKGILKAWPDTRFLTSSELGDYLSA